MKRLLLIAAFLLPMALQAQKYACVNTEYILAKVPDYSRAQSQLDKQAAAWQKELEAKFQEIDKLYKTFQQEAYLLPENLKHKREEELKAKENEVRELQMRYFGAGGDLDKKRAELMKPIQDRVYSAIERVAREKSYAFILDKAGSPTLLYVSDKYDVSDQVLEMMGINPSSATEGDKEATNPEMKRSSRR
ncbi:MAG: OmpH family outer membrane protein [Bacteroidales bacterium]|nr:OmpH family outer membrane protein [Bacteroidales bacterium]